MGWAVTLEGRSDPQGIVFLIEDRAEAESIAGEIRIRGPRVVVIPYPTPAAPAAPRLTSRPV